MHAVHRCSSMHHSIPSTHFICMHAVQVSVLDKSKMDWSTFKQSNTNVEEELEAYKKSSNQFLARCVQGSSNQYRIHLSTNLQTCACVDWAEPVQLAVPNSC